MEGGLVDVDDVNQWFVHEYPYDSLGELLLLVHQLHLPLGLRAVDDLWLSIGGSMLKVYLPYQPRG